MQTLLVILTFVLALGYLLRKFLWMPLAENYAKPSPTLDGQRTKCGNKDCGCN